MSKLYSDQAVALVDATGAGLTIETAESIEEMRALLCERWRARVLLEFGDFEGLPVDTIDGRPASFTWAEIAKARLCVLANPISHIEKAPAPGVDGIRALCGVAPNFHGGPAGATCLDCLIRCARGEE